MTTVRMMPFLFRPLHRWVLPSLILLAGLAVAALLLDYERRLMAESQRHLAEESLHGLAVSLEEALHRRLAIVDALGALAKSHSDPQLYASEQQELFKHHFQRFAGFLDHQVDGVLSMQLAPQGVVTYITNEKRNAKALGHDLLIDDTRRLQVIETIQRRSLIVAGPLDLIQGGQAIIARQAIFTEPGAFSSARYDQLRVAYPGDSGAQSIPDDFWGLATVLIDIPALYRDAGLDKVSSQYAMAIRGRHGLGQDGEVFWGDAAVFDQPTVTVPVVFQGGSWIIGVKLAPHLNFYVLLLPFFCVLGAAALAYGVASRDERNRLLAESRAKSAFLSTMSHELRTPMNAIMGFAQILKYDPTLESEQRDSVQEILMAGDHLMTLINEVLDLAKIESGTLVLKQEEVELAQLLSECYQLVLPIAEQREVELQFPTGPKGGIYVDRVRSKQVLLNLLSNAVKYNKQGGLVIVSLAIRGTYWRITVEDTGIGINAADHDKLFKPFSRINAEHSQTQGTGIGLSIVASLVSAMRGRVGMESEYGVGSRFWVELPRIEPSGRPSQSPFLSMAGHGNP